jgi:2,5-diamino-6-(ribosylamino)-4(3H)-pyrimidinone 5'-phosphate reductase
MKGSEATSRPRVICHMMIAVDGRIVTDGWPQSEEGRRQYEEVHATYEAQAWMCGRITMEQHFASGTRSAAEVANEYAGAGREDYVAPGDHGSCAIAVDPRGRLTWESGEMDGDHVVAVLSSRVSNEYLESLRSAGVSYLLAGEADVDLPLALRKIGERLGVRTVMLEGGGGINGSMLGAGLVDELSVLVAPVADTRAGTAALFDLPAEKGSPRRLELLGVEKRADDVLWLRYLVSPRAS